MIKTSRSSLLYNFYLFLCLATTAPLFAQSTPAPVFYPPSGTYTRAFTLEMTDTATIPIYYTTDNTPPTSSSTLYAGPIPINLGTTTVQAIACPIDGTCSTVTSATYTVARSATTASIAANPSPLVLPGGIQLTSVVNQAAAGGAVPSGTVSFYSDKTNLLGSAPLKIVPSTQAWNENASLLTPLPNSVGLASVVLAKGAQPVIVSAENGNPTSGTPSVALYQLGPAGTSLNSYTYFSANQPGTDAIAAGYFLKPKSTGIQSFLVHAISQYLVFDGSTTTTAGVPTLNAPVITSFAGCECSNPDDESIAIDDFDNDGYSDVGTVVGIGGFEPPTAGVALNAGASSPGSFGLLIAAPQPSTVTSLFCPLAVATGHFMTGTAGAQLAVLATTSTTTCGVTGNPVTIYLFALNTARNALTQIGTPLQLPDTYATTLAAADLNQDGTTDLIIGESIPGTTEIPTGGIRTAIGNGDGSFKTPSALSATAAPRLPIRSTTLTATEHPMSP